MSLFNRNKVETQPEFNQLSAVQAKEAKEENIRNIKNLRRIIINGNNTSSTNTVTTSNLTSSNLTGNAGTVTISNNNLLQNSVGSGTWTLSQINPYNNPHVINTYPVVPANSIKVNKFEQVLDQLFTGEEKKDFITSIGYIVNGEFASKPSQQNIDVVGTLFEAIDVIFLREISIKFKNMLLAKPVLKIKL